MQKKTIFLVLEDCTIQLLHNMLSVQLLPLAMIPDFKIWCCRLAPPLPGLFQLLPQVLTPGWSSDPRGLGWGGGWRDVTASCTTQYIFQHGHKSGPYTFVCVFTSVITSGNNKM